MALFTVQYAPRNEHQIFGQDKAVQELKDFILNYKQKRFRAALLYGPIGNGKTSSVQALAQQLHYDLLEINSSDLRNEETMKTFLGSALGQQSLFFTPKIVLIDEIDNISGIRDRGCISALLKLMEHSTFPLILTANDISDSKLKPLVKNCQLIEFHALQYRTIAHALLWVCEQENIHCEEKAVNSLARQVAGDLRAALLDLQVSATDKQFTFSKLSSLSDRKRTESIVNALTVIFKSSSVENALPALENVDLDLHDVLLWMDENLPKEYLDSRSLAKAYEYISRADVFQGRIKRQQHWRFLAYIKDLLTAGISSAKVGKNPAFVPYRQTLRFLQQWQANQKWARKKDIAKKLAWATHTSTKVARQQVPYLQAIFRKSPAENMVKELNLSDEEVEWLRN